MGDTRPLAESWSWVRNYLGQLRLYSFADLALLLIAAGASGHQIVGGSLLWFGFLIYLEWFHEDVGRARWRWYAWALLWGGAILWVQSWAVVPFIVLSVLYALKKEISALGAISPLLNGGLKTALLVLVPTVSMAFAATVFAVASVRNLCGDFRDTEKDAREGVHTVPVRLGCTKNITWLYPLALSASSGLWVLLGHLPAWSVVPAWLVQRVTYGWTPR